jgi:hypothetical protein
MKAAHAALLANAPFTPCQKGTYLELYRFNRLRTAGLDGPAVERAVRAGKAALLARTQVTSRRGYFVAWGDDLTALTAIAALVRTL